MKKKICTTLLITTVGISSYLVGTLNQVSQVEAEKAKWSYAITKNTFVFNCKTKKHGNSLYEKLQKRKGKIYIEVVQGKVLDNKGNGKDNSGFYIHYDTKRFKKGDKVETAFVYNPQSNYTDDYVARVDTLISRKSKSK